MLSKHFLFHSLMIIEKQPQQREKENYKNWHDKYSHISHEFTNSIEIPINSLVIPRWFFFRKGLVQKWKNNNFKPATKYYYTLVSCHVNWRPRECLFVSLLRACVRTCSYILFICFYSFISFNPTGASTVIAPRKRLNNTKLCDV